MLGFYPDTHYSLWKNYILFESKINGHKIQPGDYPVYIQNAKLGTDDLEFKVRIR